jgi:hypothetical protein
MEARLLVISNKTQPTAKEINGEKYFILFSRSLDTEVGLNLIPTSWV